MADLSWVTERIAVGGAIESMADVRVIASKGVTHVLNLRDGDHHPEHFAEEAPWLAKAGLDYHLNPVHDDGKKKPPEWFQRSIEYALGVLSKPNAKLFVHCKAGINRSPATVFAILYAFGIPDDDAREHVLEARAKATDRYFDDAYAAVNSLGYCDE